MLTQRQSRFVEEYAAGRNGTQAAIQAGYSARTARAIACENLQKPEIADAIERRSAALSRKSAVRTRKAQAEKDRVVTKLKNIAFANIQDVFNLDGTIKDPAEWSEAARDAFRLVRRKGVTKIMRSEDRLRALDLLAKHLGMFQTKRRRR
jgi:phage terminase small subunit